MKKHTQSPYESSKVSYKPSGIEWLGEIPHHWEIKKAKGIFKEVKRSVKDNDEIITCFRDGIVTLRKNRRTEGFTNSLKEIGYQGIRVNDLVIHSMDAFAGAIGVSDSNGKATPVYVVCVPRYDNLADNKYYAYLLRNVANSGFILSLAKGIRERSTEFKYNDFADLKIPLPPLQEQKEIAEFLDKKCEKIQNYIDKKQKLITLLQEKKQALINEAVTKGLNPSIESKNSDIEYLGLIPHHWEVRRVATLGKFFKGSNISKNDLQDSGVSVVLYGDIYTKYEIKTKQFQSKIAENFAKDKTQILCGDLLFSGSGETKEDIGKCICYLGNEKAYVGGDVIVLRQMGQDSLFLSYVLNSDYIKYQKAVISKGEIIIHIYASNLRDLKIPLPPLQEQKQIANFLDKKCEKINSVIEKTKKQIELIKEYKNTLINEAVCGRINLERK
ncbi:restriction endonuclease subunit S [Campylobacter upsaliensis]|nr:restriction endonuclease subunit S [Campylobacter upsaliensis]